MQLQSAGQNSFVVNVMEIVSATNSSAMVDKTVQMEQMKLTAVSVACSMISVSESDADIIIIRLKIHWSCNSSYTRLSEAHQMIARFSTLFIVVRQHSD